MAVWAVSARGSSCGTCFVFLSHGAGVYASSGTSYAKLGRTKLSSSDERCEPLSTTEPDSVSDKKLAAILRGCRGSRAVGGCRGECNVKRGVVCCAWPEWRRWRSCEGCSSDRGAREESVDWVALRNALSGVICVSVLDRRHRRLHVRTSVRPAPLPPSPSSTASLRPHASTLIAPIDPLSCSTGALLPRSSAQSTDSSPSVSPQSPSPVVVVLRICLLP